MNKNRLLCPLCSLTRVDAKMSECPTCRGRIFRGVALAFKKRRSGRLRWFLVCNPENERRQAREIQGDLGPQWHHYGTSNTSYMLYRNGTAAML